MNPPRTDGPCPHLSRGRKLVPQRYIIGWPHGVLKVGSTLHGRKRWGQFISHGGALIDLAYYAELEQAAKAEAWLHEQLRQRYQPAFKSREEAAEVISSDGNGWMDCFAVPQPEWMAVKTLGGAP